MIYKINKIKNFLIDEDNAKFAGIYIRIRFSNLFVTLTDFNNKVIVCKTAGSSGIKGNKRKKKTEQAIQSIVSSLKYYFKRYRISRVNLFLRCRIRTQVFSLVTYLLRFNIGLNRIFKTLPKNYTRVKKRNARRR